MKLWMALNSKQSSCSSLHSAVIIGTYHHCLVSYMSLVHTGEEMCALCGVFMFPLPSPVTSSSATVPFLLLSWRLQLCVPLSSVYLPTCLSIRHLYIHHLTPMIYHLRTYHLSVTSINPTVIYLPIFYSLLSDIFI